MTEDVRPLSMDPSDTVFPIMEESQDGVAGSQPDSLHTRPTPPASQQSSPNLDRIDSLHLTAEPEKQRSRPISEVVNDAFQHSPATHQVSPEIISMITAQVTEQVIKHISQQQVSTSMSATPVPLQQNQTIYPPPPPSRSPDSSGSTRGLFTPPTPGQYAIGNEYQGARPPSVALSDSGSHFSHVSRESLRNEEMPRPVKTDSSTTIRKRSPANIGSPLHRRSTEIERADSTRRRMRKDSQTSEAARGRPTEESSENEETVIEKQWRPLFTDGCPNFRLDQFLRGLAVHLIDDYEPKGSLVVTPQKMLKFFNDTRVDEEHYPWDVIFGGKMAYRSLSLMYRRLMCDHHLTQSNCQEQPSLPGLTPQGFACFMTCLIQAHPSIEYDRIAKAVMDMPISNADDTTERFPKELPRRLLPMSKNIQAEQRLISSLSHEPYVLGEIKGAPPMPPPPQRQAHNSFNDRERQFYGEQSQHSDVTDDDDVFAPNPLIERERKPYTAKEGTGKVYTSEETRSTANQYKSVPTVIPSTERNFRPQSNSMYSSSNAPSDPVNIPSRMPRRVSFNESNTMPNTLPSRMNAGYPKPAPNVEEPSTRNQFHRRGTFDSSNVGALPNQSFEIPLHPVKSTPAAPELGSGLRGSVDSRNRNRFKTNNMAPEVTTGARASNRNSVPNINTLEYGSLGGPVGGPPQSLPSLYPKRRQGPPVNPSEDYNNRKKSNADLLGHYSPADYSIPNPPKASTGPSAQH